MIHQFISFYEDRKEVGIETYFLDYDVAFRRGKDTPLVLICPGGGYAFLSEREMEPVAMAWNFLGFHAAVLHYSTGRAALMPQPLLDVAMGVKWCREHAKRYHIRQNGILLCGFSAGGHVAAGLGVHWDKTWFQVLMEGESQMWRPDGLVLGYPLINIAETKRKLPYIEDFSMANHDVEEDCYVFAKDGERYIDFMKLEYSYLFHKVDPDEEQMLRWSLDKQVSESTPPCFLWHTGQDNLVWAANSLKFAAALERYRVPYELHVFARGYHGLSLASESSADQANGIVPECQEWITMAGRWIRGLSESR